MLMIASLSLTAGSTSGCSASGNINEKRPSNPFVLHGVQHSGIPVSHPFEAHPISHSGMESSPFVLQTGSVNAVLLMETRNRGSSQQKPPLDLLMHLVLISTM